MVEDMFKEKVADVLDKAAEELKREGWCRGTAFDNQGRMCMLGALGMASGVGRGVWNGFEDVEPMILFRMSRKEVTKYLGLADQHGIPSWNDAEGRTAEDVVTVLEKTAIAVRERVE